RQCFERFGKTARSLFNQYIVRGLSISGISEHPFRLIKGDGGGAYLSNPNIIPDVLMLAKELLPYRLIPSLRIRWNVAKDEWDKKNMKTIQ
ncbi:MAG: hypothetical protein AAB884_02570, partial [Patescibacteria group bacterium]